MGPLRTFVLRVLLKIAWSVGGTADAVDGLPRLAGPALEPLYGALRPGDLVLLGNNGLLSHVSVYTGDGEVVHAMATEKTMRGWIGSIGDAVRRIFGQTEHHVGVIRERLGSFLERFERDTWVVVRAPTLTEAGLARGLARISGLVGAPYDYGFRTENEAWYCTEIVDAFLRAALGDAAPVIPSKRIRVRGLLDEQVLEPAALLEAPGLVVVAANDAARANYADRVPSPSAVP